MIRVSRAINGITINGDEYILDKNNEIMLFENEKQAKQFLKENGVKSFKGLNFEVVGK